MKSVVSSLGIRLMNWNKSLEIILKLPHSAGLELHDILEQSAQVDC
jgi:hypothetical protein